MKKLLIYLPNSLTVLRLLLLAPFFIVLAGQLSHSGGNLPPTLYCILLLIYVTDFLDGKLARALGAVSDFGGILDITADCLFIMLSLIVFNFFNILPIWFTIVVILDFLVFLLTSHVLRLQGTCEHILIFDTIGRVAAAAFYGIPLLACLTLQNPVLQAFLRLVLSVNTALAGISMTARCIRCVRPLLLKQE